MTLCAICRRDVNEHSETQASIHLKKLSKYINESEVLRDFFPWFDTGASK